MRTLKQIEARIQQRQARQTLLRALGAPATLLAQEEAITQDLRRQCAKRQEHVQRCFKTSVALA